MNPMISIPLELSIPQAKARFVADFVEVAPNSTATSSYLFDRISTPNWALEWGLPYWLGKSLGLSTETTWEFLLSTLYLLAFARVADDLADGESTDGTEQYLSIMLYHLCVLQYSRLLNNDGDWADTANPASSTSSAQARLRFWGYFADYMTEWLHTTFSGQVKLECCLDTHQSEDLLSLARRGAFLKICCAAACCLVGEENKIQPLTHVLEEVLVGVVMLDDEFDWAADLEAGRPNAFVAHCSSLPQIPPNVPALRSAVLRSIYLSNQADLYFDLILQRMAVAKVSAHAVACSGLVDFICAYEEEVKLCRQWLRERATEQLRELLAIRVIFSADQPLSAEPSAVYRDS